MDMIDYCFVLIEEMLTLKKFKSRKEIIDACTLITQMVDRDEKINQSLKDSYKEALEKISELSFREMKELISILNTPDEEFESKEECGSQYYKAGIEAYENHDFGNAYNYFLKASEFWNVEAIYSLGLCMFYGIGTKQDKLSAIKKLCEASDLGYYKSDIFLQDFINNI